MVCSLRLFTRVTTKRGINASGYYSVKVVGGNLSLRDIVVIFITCSNFGVNLLESTCKALNNVERINLTTLKKKEYISIRRVKNVSFI